MEFTQEMKNIIINTYPKYGINKTLENLSLNEEYKYEVQRMAQKLNLKRTEKYYSQEEIKFLKDNYSMKSVEEISLILNKSKESIIYKANALGLSNSIHYYSEEDIIFLKNNYGIISAKKIAETLGKTYNSVISKANKLGLKNNTKWTEEDLNLLKEVYPYYTNKEIIEKYFYNRKIHSIEGMARKLELCKINEKSNRWYNQEDIIKNFKQVIKEIDRVPFEAELVSLGLPSGKTINRYFNTSYSQFCVDMGFIPNSNLFGMSVKCYSINGVYCASKSEKIICDFLETHNISYIKEAKYSDYIKDERCRNKRFDWVIDNYFIEYFGMSEKSYYKERMEEKMQICKDNNICLISLFRSDLNKLEKKLHMIL